MQVSEIYARHPEWDQGSRRLGGSLDHWNTRSWTGCVDTRKVNVVQAWTAGMMRAHARFAATGLFSAADLDFAAIASLDVALDGGDPLYPTVLMPRGVRVGAQLPQAPA